MTQENINNEELINDMRKLEELLLKRDDLEKQKEILQKNIEHLEEEKDKLMSGTEDEQIELMDILFKECFKEYPLFDLVIQHDELYDMIKEGKSGMEEDMYVYEFTEEEEKAIKDKIKSCQDCFIKAEEQLHALNHNIEYAQKFINGDLENEIWFDDKE